jgi:hypothetical protein
MSNQSIKRRSFISGSIATVGGVLLSGNILASHSSQVEASKKGYTFLSESGNFGKGGLYVIGLLTCVDSGEQHEENIKALRLKHNYRTRMTYKDGDTYKLPFTKDCIDYFFNTDSLIFTAAIIKQVEPTSVDKSNLSNEQLRVEKSKLIKQLIDLQKIEVTDVVARSQSRYGPSYSFTEKFKDWTSLNYEARDIRTGNNLLQLVDQMTGSIASDIVGKVASKTKITLTEYLKKKINVSSFEKISRKETKFRVIETSLLKK